VITFRYVGFRGRRSRGRIAKGGIGWKSAVAAAALAAGGTLLARKYGYDAKLGAGLKRAYEGARGLYGRYGPSVLSKGKEVLARASSAAGYARGMMDAYRASGRVRAAEEVGAAMQF